MNILRRNSILWIQFLCIWYPMSIVTGENMGPDLESYPRMFISRDPTNRRIQIQATMDPCSSSADDDFIGYVIDPCTGRVTNQNYWGSSSPAFSGCPTTAPTFYVPTTPPRKSSSYSPTMVNNKPTQVSNLNSKAPTYVKSPTLIPKGPSSQTDSRSSRKPSMITSTQSPTARFGPTIVLTPSMKYITQIPTSNLGRPTLLESSTKPPTMPTRLRPTGNSISSKPTLLSRGNNTIVDPIGKSPQIPQHSNNNGLALGLGLAAFVGLAFLVSRTLWKRKKCNPTV